MGSDQPTARLRCAKPTANLLTMKLDQPILFASGNAHKLDEVRGALAPAGLTIDGLDLLQPIEEPVEDQPTFEGNAILKAMYYSKQTGRICLADDSGLMVDALGGKPGVLSARYAGVTGAPRNEVDAANNAKLLDALRDVSDNQRTARFVCCMALCDADNVLVQVRGEVVGSILTEPRGRNGFGYDPLFCVAKLGRTAAELEPAEKNAISHRGEACRLMLEAIRNATL